MVTWARVPGYYTVLNFCVKHFSQCFMGLGSKQPFSISIIKMAPDSSCGFLLFKKKKYPEKQVLPYVGVLRPKCEKHVAELSTKVCSNHFQAGYHWNECPNPTLYLKGYSAEEVLTPKPKKQRRSSLSITV